MNKTLVFKAGIWKDTKYTNKDLKATVDSYNRVKVSAPWTVGHQVLSGQPAAGWLRDTEYKEDENGVGEIWALSDFNSLGQKMLDEKTHENKSISFYPKKSPYSPDPEVNFIRHIAMLGAEMPALSNLGPIALVDFSEDLSECDLLTFSCSCESKETEKTFNNDKLTMSEYEKLMKIISELAEKIADMKPEESEVPTPALPSLTAAQPDPDPVQNSIADILPADASILATEDDEMDYKAMYEKSQEELKSMRQNSASASLAQTVESYYSEGTLNEEVISAKDLTLCLTKLELGHDDFSDKESPREVIQALIESLRLAQPKLQIPLGEETSEVIEDFSDESINIDMSSSVLGDDFAIEAEKIAVNHGLSFSQGMSALLSAQAFSAESGVSLTEAVKTEVNRFKINK